MLPFHGFVAIYTVIVLAFNWSLDPLKTTAHPQYFSNFGRLYLVVLPFITVVWLTIVVLVRTNDWTTRRSTLATRLAPDVVGRFLSAMITLAALIVFMGSFTTFKTLMPDLMGGFPYDRTHAEMDALLHLGRDPGLVLIRIMDWPILRAAIEWNYSILWSMAGFLPIYFIATSVRADKLRLRYFLTWALTWVVIGNVLACLFLSAGPAFYGEVTGDRDRFAALLAAISDTTGDSTVAAFQAYLWNNYLAGTASLGTGISAFPSMHVGLAMMQALFLREYSRLAGHAGFVYVAIIVISSVCLGWHYAIDGYVSIVVALAVYAGIKRLLTPRPRTASLTPGPIAAQRDDARRTAHAASSP